ncbi:MAG: ATP phosphoribosyltransferase, partial [Bdellovibrionales bacterium]|nr:ATP phosphoribosyltransferase [Bdellovibrionales bacterium]
IATSYPRVLREFLDSNHVVAEICEVRGAAELAPRVSLSDCVCDLVSSGSTLYLNGLSEVVMIMESEAVLVAGSNLNSRKRLLVEELCFRIKAVLAAQLNRYVVLNAPNDRLTQIIDLLPGLKSPSVVPLGSPGWSAVHSVINQNRFWEVLAALQEAGAQGILVMPIEQMVL